MRCRGQQQGAHAVRVAQRAFRNGALTPHAWRRRELGYEEIAESMAVNLPLRKYLFRNPAEGGAAVVLCSAQRARRDTDRSVIVNAAVMHTRHFSSFEDFNPGLAATQAPAPTVTAARATFELVGVGPRDVDLIELQDAGSGSELIHIADNGSCEHGEQAHLLASGAIGIEGRLPLRRLVGRSRRRRSGKYRGEGVHPARRRGRIKQM
jgi:hypothetical protein